MSNLSWHVVGGAGLLIAVGTFAFMVLGFMAHARQLDNYAARLKAVEGRDGRPPGTYRP